MNIKTYTENREGKKLALITEIYDINVIDSRGTDFGRCYMVQIWHNDGGLNYPDCFIQKNKDDISLFSDSDVIFDLTEDSIQFIKHDS